MERKITKILNEWKKEENKPCLLISGARQIGKTYIIEEFAKTNYKNYIYINFELMPEAKKIFDGNLDIKTLKMKLEVSFPNVLLQPYETMVFLDEIQSCPNARTALKTFAIDKTIDVIASGSLLGLYYKEVSSYPVGYERIIEMYALDFEEFLVANGISKSIIELLKNSFSNKEKVDPYILNRISELFKIYIVVGGMPKVVNEYVQTGSIQRVKTLQRDIINSYILDVNKYADKSDKQKIIKAFYSIPAQLSKKNKKFMYSEIDIKDANIGERKYLTSIDWLKDAGIINYCYNLTEPASPLYTNLRLNCFKLYVRDTGLLVSMLEPGVEKDILSDDLYINEGAILENVCASEIKTRYENVMYFEKKSKLEIDFIINIDGLVTAIEVKSANNKQGKSLLSIINNYKTVSRYIKFEKDINIYVDENNIEHYPLFMIMFL